MNIGIDTQVNAEEDMKSCVLVLVKNCVIVWKDTSVLYSSELCAFVGVWKQLSGCSYTSLGDSS